MPLTRIQIVNQALDLTGLDSGFQAKGREWLNIIIERLALRQDYKFYEKTADTAFIQGQRDYALPADFSRAETIYYVQNNGQVGYPIPIVESYMFDQYNYGIINGMPTMAMIDDEDDTVRFNSNPVPTNDSYRLRYYRKPVLLSTSSSDDNLVPDFKDQDTLLEELKAMCFEFRDDQRYMSKKQEAAKTNRDYQRNMYQDNENSQTELNKFYFRSTRRTGRFGSFGTNG